VKGDDMGYVYVVPSITEYAKRFKELDSLDFKIIRAMYRYGVRNVSRIAKLIGVPQQTVSYRVKRFDERDLVRFRALINEEKLGLKSYLVVADVPLGKEELSSYSMSCFPLWRYLAIVDGWKHGNYVRYIIPPDKEADLKAFLDKLKNLGLILGYEVYETTGPNYPLLNLDFYAKKEGSPVFNWNRWINDFDSFAEEEVSELTSFVKAKFDLYDLIILRCLEINARMKFREIAKEIAEVFGEKNYKKFIPLISRRFKNIVSQGLIKSYRVTVFPNLGLTVLFLIYYLKFTNSSNLGKFLGGLSHLPYNFSYTKILSKDEIFLHIIVPVYEYLNLCKTLSKLGELGCLKKANLLVGNLPQAWDNVKIYEMYKDGAWNFSYGVALKMLKEALIKRNIDIEI